jgi:hypothetical protein
MNKIQKLKETVSKIDIGKITNYSENNPNSKTLRQVIRYSKRIIDSENEEEILKLSERLAYNFDTIVNISKYIKNEKEKKY